MSRFRSNRHLDEMNISLPLETAGTKKAKPNFHKYILLKTSIFKRNKQKSYVILVKSNYDEIYRNIALLFNVNKRKPLRCLSYSY